MILLTGFFFGKFARVKKKLIILPSFLIASVFFSILFQTVHSYAHFAEQRLEKKCLHKYNSDKEITHQHQSLEHCFVCDNSIGNYISPVFFTFQVIFEQSTIPYFRNLPEIITTYSGINFSLRGPPQFIG